MIGIERKHARSFSATRAVY